MSTRAAFKIPDIMSGESANVFEIEIKDTTAPLKSSGDATG
jgi:hypothetical protein